jgi:hypothetical protein
VAMESISTPLQAGLEVMAGRTLQVISHEAGFHI